MHIPTDLRKLKQRLVRDAYIHAEYDERTGLLDIKRDIQIEYLANGKFKLCGPKVPFNEGVDEDEALRLVKIALYESAASTGNIGLT